MTRESVSRSGRPESRGADGRHMTARPTRGCTHNRTEEAGGVRDEFAVATGGTAQATATASERR